MNRQTGTARPAQETLARDLGATIRTVQRMLDLLRPLGLTIVPGHGPNRASTYWIEPKGETENTTPVSPLNTTPMSPIDAPNTRHTATENTTSGDRKHDTHVAPTNKKNQEEEPREEARARANARTPRTRDPGLPSASMKKGVGAEGRKKPNTAPSP